MKKKLIIRAVFALKERSQRQIIKTQQNANEIAHINRTLKLHGEAHQANDILPQFTALCKKVNGHEAQLNNSPFSKVVMEDYARRLGELEEAQEITLKVLPEVEILKVKVVGIEQDNTRSYAVHHKEAFDAVYANMKEQRSDYHGHIGQLVEENAAAHIQMSDTIMDMKEQLIQLRKAATLQGQHIVGLEQNLSQYQDAARVQANRQAVAIEKLQKQVEGLETRLSRAQDLVAAIENEKADMWKPATRPVERGCPKCLYGSNGPSEGPCRDCFPPEWPNCKPERKPRLDTTPRNCSTCRYQRRGADDEPCKRCVVNDAWTPKTERKPRAPRTKDARGNSAPATSKTVTPRRKKGTCSCKNDEKVM